MMGQKKEGTAMDIKKLIQNKTFRLLLTAVLVLLIIYNHRANIKRLLTGTENKFYKKK